MSKLIQHLCCGLLLSFGYTSLATAASPHAASPPPSGQALSAPTMSSAELERFTEDLQWLQRELPRTHAALYHHTPRRQFVQACEQLRQRLPQLSRSAAIVELARLVGLARDGHTALFLLPFPGAPAITGIRQLPLQLYDFEDGLRIVAISSEHRRWLGARIAAIGDVPVEQAKARVLPLLPRDNTMGEREYSARYLSLYDVLEALRLATDGKVELRLEAADGQLGNLVLPVGKQLPDASWVTRWVHLPGPRADWVAASDAAPAPLWLSQTDAAYQVHWLPQGVVYAQINQLRNAPERSFADYVQDVSRMLDAHPQAPLILDLRLNRGGNGDLRWSLIHALLQRPHLREPGRVRVLIGRRTFSAAQMLANDLERHLQASFIGEPTGSSPNHYGELGQSSLPGTGLPLAVATLYWQHDPRDTRPWIPPHVVIEPSFADLAAGRDPVLQAALDYQPPPSVATLMQPGLDAGEVQTAISAFRTVLETHHNPYRNLFETELNTLGYALLDQRRGTDAVAVLQLATELYPLSWNAWDSLGEALVMNRQRARAAYCYARSVHLNPSNRSGAAALQRLLQRRN